MQKRIVDILPPSQKQEEMKEVKKIEEPQQEIGPARVRWPKILLLIPLLIAAAVAAYFSLGEAKVEIWPKLDSFSSMIKVTVDKNAQAVSLPQKTIPGYIFETATTVSQDFSSSGKAVKEQKATGVIRVYNNSQLSQTLIKNTRFQPPQEKFQPSLERGENPWFKSQETIIIPPKAYKDVGVVADAPGEKYNIKPSKFSLPGLVGTSQYTLVYGESLQDFEGGLKATISQVSSGDLIGAKDSLSQKIKDESIADLRAKLPPGFLLLADGLRTDVTDSISSVKAGSLSDKFNYAISAETTALAFKKDDMDSLAGDFIASQISEGRKVGPNSLGQEYAVFSLDPQPSKMVLNVDIKAKTYLGVANDLSLKSGLLGKTTDEAKLFLQGEPGIERAKISLWPFWLRSIPMDIKRLDLKMVF